MFRFMLLFAAALFSSTIAAAHEVEPLIIDLTPSGQGASATMRVTNRDPVPVAVEVFAEKRIIDENGVETRVKADSDFLLVPAQLRVEPGQTGTLRIRYIGGPVEKSEGYAVTVAQLNLDNVEQTGVKILVNFAASVHVVPRNAKSQVTASEPVIATPEGGTPAINFVISNSGARHQGMAAGRITLTTPDGRRQVLEGDIIRSVLKHTLIPAMASRNVSLPLPEGWSATDKIAVTLEVPGAS